MKIFRPSNHLHIKEYTLINGLINAYENVSFLVQNIFSRAPFGSIELIARAIFQLDNTNKI